MRWSESYSELLSLSRRWWCSALTGSRELTTPPTAREWPATMPTKRVYTTRSSSSRTSKTPPRAGNQWSMQALHGGVPRGGKGAQLLRGVQNRVLPKLPIGEQTGLLLHPGGQRCREPADGQHGAGHQVQLHPGHRLPAYQRGHLLPAGPGLDGPGVLPPQNHGMAGICASNHHASGHGCCLFLGLRH